MDEVKTEAKWMSLRDRRVRMLLSTTESTIISVPERYSAPAVMFPLIYLLFPLQENMYTMDKIYAI